MAKEATLSGTNTTSKPLTNSSITINGTVRPGSSATSYNGTIFFGGKNVTFAQGSELQVNARHCATNTNDGCTSIANIGTLTMNGTLRVTLVNNHKLQAGDSIRVWNCATLSGTPTLDLPDGIEWDTSRLSEGLLFVKSVSDGIQQLRISQQQPADIFDLSGRLVRKHATSTEGLPAGIYIIRGRKVVVR